MGPTSFSVPPGGSQDVTVIFSPTSAGTRYATLAINSNDPQDPVVRLIVNGTGTGGPDLQIAGQVLFNASRDGNQEIYTMNADGSGQTRLTNSSANEVSAAYSPDGTRIVFDRDPNNNGHIQIFTMNTDGSGITHLTNNWAARGPSWSPDGTKIAFFNSPDNNTYDIYTMNADGSDQTRLTFTSQDEYDPSWSPDGSKIAFWSNRDGNGEIYVMNANGSSQLNLSHTPAASEGNPRWSPDGAKIAFWSNRDGNQEIYMMNADGSNQTRLTNNSAIDESPTWSQDGTKIIFASTRDGNYELYVMNAVDGSGQTRLTNNTTVDQTPSWAMPYRIGSASVGGSVSRTMTIENKGNAPLYISGITSSDEQFDFNPTSFSVPPGGSQDVEVSFTPTTAGTVYSPLTIESNDPDAPEARLVMNGTGIAPIEPPPFTYDKPLPDEETCLCLPPYMVQNPLTDHQWWARATGDRDLEIILVAEAVNASETGSATIKVFDPANNLVGTATVAHPASGETSAIPIAASGASTGDLYRIEVSVAPPPSGMPARHYRLKLKGASLLGANSPLQAQAENDEARWQVNVLPGEDLDMVVSPGPEAPATYGTVEVRDPSGVLGASAPINTPVHIPGAIAGMWSVSVLGADHHYVIDKTTGADQGIYVSWMTWGDGQISGTITRAGLPNTTPVTVEIVEVLRGIVVQTIPGVTSN